MHYPAQPSILALTILLITGSAFGEQPASSDTKVPAFAGDSFYRDKERGWFWYETSPEEV